MLTRPSNRPCRATASARDGSRRLRHSSLLLGITPFFNTTLEEKQRHPRIMTCHYLTGVRYGGQGTVQCSGSSGKKIALTVFFFHRDFPRCIEVSRVPTNGYNITEPRSVHYYKCDALILGGRGRMTLSANVVLSAMYIGASCYGDVPRVSMKLGTCTSGKQPACEEELYVYRYTSHTTTATGFLCPYSPFTARNIFSTTTRAFQDEWSFEEEAGGY